MKHLILCAKYEWKKSLFVQKGLWIACVGLLFHILLFVSVKPDMYRYVFSAEVYRSYAEQFAGVYSAETAQAIERELQEQKETVVLLEAKEAVSGEEYALLSNRIAIAQEKIPALEALQGKYASLEKLQRYKAELIYDLELTSYFEKFRIDWICLLCVAIITVNIALGDYQRGMEQLLVPSKMGKKRIRNGKIAVICFISGVLEGLFYVIQAVLIRMRWNLGDLQVPLQSCSGFELCTVEISIKEALVVGGIVRTLATIAVALLLAFLARVMKHGVLAIAVVILIIGSYLMLI